MAYCTYVLWSILCLRATSGGQLNMNRISYCKVPNFLVFRGWHRTSKIKLCEILEYRIAALTESLVRENCFHEIFENANQRKLCASNIRLYSVICYTVYRTLFKCEHVIIANCDFSPSAQLSERNVYIPHSVNQYVARA